MDKKLLEQGLKIVKDGIALLEQAINVPEITSPPTPPNPEFTGTDTMPEIPQQKPVHIFIDAGHGGISPVTGQYVTAPSKMHNFDTNVILHDGSTFYEGVFNRQVADALAQMLQDAEISWSFVHHEWKDNSLFDRVKKANDYHTTLQKQGKTSVYMSIHGNAFTDPKAEGFSVFVYENASRKSMNLADFLGQEVIKDMPEFKYRRQRPHDYSWHSRFYVLKNTRMPAFLSENGFFTNLEDAQDMVNPNFIKRIAKQHFDTAVYAQHLV